MGKRKANKSLMAWVKFVKSVQKKYKLNYKDAISKAKVLKDKGANWKKPMKGGDDLETQEPKTQGPEEEMEEEEDSNVGGDGDEDGDGDGDNIEGGRRRRRRTRKHSRRSKKSMSRGRARTFKRTMSRRKAASRKASRSVGLVMGVA